MAGLEQKMEDMATGAGPAKPLNHVINGLKVARYEQHYIFGLERPDALMLILAVLHTKMQVIERLKKRL